METSITLPGLLAPGLSTLSNPNSALLSGPALNNEFCITIPKASENESFTVPNEFPPYDTQKKIALLGEAPGKDEVREGRPFVGASGNLLFGRLRKFGINRADCLIANVSQIPIDEECKKPWLTFGIGPGLEQLQKDISQHRPNCILLMGGCALKAAFPNEDRKITDWRGSILQVTDPTSVLYGYKVIPCIHPAAVFRDWSQWPLFDFDVTRFAQESRTNEYDRPIRLFELTVPAHRAVKLLREISNIPTPVALDIEGGVNGISCVSFATSPNNCFIVPLATYPDHERIIVLRELYEFLSSNTPKILQNQLYDNFVLSWSYFSNIRNVVWDTMLSGWEIYPELPKGLGTQVSIWTREPFYKMDRKSTSIQTLHEYCCKDSACTYEIYLAHKAYFTGRQSSYDHFRFNMSLLPALLYMELRGMAYDKSLANSMLTETYSTLSRIQSDIDKNILDVWSKHGSRGEKPASVNINSPKQLCVVLFQRFGYPKQHPKKGRERDTTKLTTNIDALLELKKTYNGLDDQILENILRYRHYDGIRETLEIRQDNDGRVRCSYNLVGTETGRLGCSTGLTGSGANLTTITKSLRKLYRADEDHWLFQCDLSGADGWTVAAHCALRGDETMLEDYYAGIKPAKVIVLLRRHGSIINTYDRAKLKELCKEVSEDGLRGWEYFSAKVSQHGTNYGLGPDKQSDLILRQSYKLFGQAFIVSKHECQNNKDFYLSRYPGVPLWQRWVRNEIDTHSTLQCASGHIRKFFGRYKDNATHREAYAHEPQANTTYATNLSLYRLWTDKQNRKSEREVTERTRVVSQFIIEPLHHVHDALIGQFHKRDTEWAIARIRTYFDNPLEIAGRTITIPFEGAYGPSWGQLGVDYGGGKI